MEDADALIREELERLAAAHLAMDTADEAYDLATSSSSESKPFQANSPSEDLELSPSTASHLLEAQRQLLLPAKEQTALVSLPPWITLPPNAEYLFKLAPPLDTTSKFEETFGLPKGSVEGVKADRTGDYGEAEVVEKVEFVFVSGPGKDKIGNWYSEHAGTGDGGEGIKEQPLFVKLTKTGAMGR